MSAAALEAPAMALANMVRAGLSPSNAVVIDEWNDPGYGLEVAWSLGDLIAVQIPGEMLILWERTPQHDGWAQSAWSLSSPEQRAEIMRGERFGSWDGADWDNAPGWDGDAWGSDLLIVNGEPVAARMIGNSAMSAAPVAAALIKAGAL